MMVHLESGDVRSRRILTVLCILYLALGSALALRTPVWQNPDEPAHYRFVERIAAERALPQAEIRDPNGYEALQPPVYYVVMAPVLAASGDEERGSLVTVRLATLLIGIPLILLTFRLAMSCLPSGIVGSDRSWLALAAAAFVGLLPQGIAVAASANNDIVAAVASVGIVCLSLAWEGRPFSYRRALVFGFACGVALMTKLTAAPAVMVALVIFFMGRHAARSVRKVAVALAATCLTLAPWLILNHLRYGDPLGETMFHRFARDLYDLPRFGEPGYGLGSFVRDSFTSFWGELGWLDTRAPQIYYVLAALFCVIAGAGVFFFLLRAGKLGRLIERPLVLLICWLVLQILVYVRFNVEYYQPQGRYLFSALPSIAILAALGLRHWIPARGRASRGRITFAVVTAVLIAANATIHFVVVPEIPEGPCPTCAGGRLLEDAVGGSRELRQDRVEQSLQLV